MKVVKLTQSEKVKDRYYIDLEDGSVLKVNINLIADYSLFTGRELDDSELERLKADSASAELRARALRITASRAMSRREITERLERKGAADKDAEETADWLESLGIIDDGEYARMVARHYRAMGYGVGKIKNELYRRGVPKEFWEPVLEELGGAEDAVDRLIKAKLKSSEPDRKEIKRLTDLLARRGFTWGEIRDGLERYRISLEEIDYEI